MSGNSHTIPFKSAQVKYNRRSIHPKETWACPHQIRKDLLKLVRKKILAAGSRFSGLEAMYLIHHLDNLTGRDKKIDVAESRWEGQERIAGELLTDRTVINKLENKLERIGILTTKTIAGRWRFVAFSADALATLTSDPGDTGTCDPGDTGTCDPGDTQPSSCNPTHLTLLNNNTVDKSTQPKSIIINRQKKIPKREGEETDMSYFSGICSMIHGDSGFSYTWARKFYRDIRDEIGGDAFRERLNAMILREDFPRTPTLTPGYMKLVRGILTRPKP